MKEAYNAGVSALREGSPNGIHSLLATAEGAVQLCRTQAVWFKDLYLFECLNQLVELIDRSVFFNVHSRSDLSLQKDALLG